MSDRLELVRGDLAFLRAVAEDRGALPEILGWHLIAIGLIWGLDFPHMWGIFAGLFPWPQSLRWIPWLPALPIYALANGWLSWRSRGTPLGPSARVFGASWAAMAAMIPPAVGVLLVGQSQSGHPFYLVWPALAFVLYGGVWTLAAIVRRKPSHAAAAAGCFCAALLCARLIGDLTQWPVIAAGLFLLVALPGLLIVRSARRTKRLEARG